MVLYSTPDVNPENFATRYYFEYGTSSTFATEPEKTKEVSIGEGGTAEAVSVHLTDLAPDTEYHFRVVAVNADNDKSLGPEVSFTTQPSGAGALPDGQSMKWSPR